MNKLYYEVVQEDEGMLCEVLEFFFGYSRSYSVTTMLSEIDISDFDSVINHFKCVFKQQLMRCSNPVVRQLVMLCTVVCLSM